MADVERSNWERHKANRWKSIHNSIGASSAEKNAGPQMPGIVGSVEHQGGKHSSIHIYNNVS